MAIIEQFSYENAFTYRKCLIPLYNQGFVYIKGRNGSGKSTPWEVLQHLFYGTTSRGLSKNGIVCTVPREDPDEETGFLSEAILRNVGGQYEGRWLVRESRDHKKYKTSLKVFKEIGGDWSLKWEDGSCPKKQEDARKLAASILGLRQNEFAGCLYLSQSGSHTLIEGKPSERMLYLAYLFGVDRYDDLLKVMKERLSKIDKQLIDTISLEARQQELQRQLSDTQDAEYLTEQIAQLKNAKKLADTNLKDWQSKRDTARDNIKTAEQRESLQRDLDDLGDVDTDEFEATAEKLETINDKRDKLRDLLSTAKRREDLETKISDLVDDTPEDDYPDDIDSEIESIVTKRSKLAEQISAAEERQEIQDELDSLGEIDSDPDELSENIETITTDLEVKRNKYKMDMAQFKELEQLIEDVESGTCPTCHRPMDIADMIKMRDKLENGLQTLYDEMEKPKKKLAKLKGKLADSKKAESLRERLKGFQATDAKDLKAERVKLRKELSRLTEARDNLSEIKTLRSQLSKLPESDRKALSAKLVVVDGKLEITQDLYDTLKKAKFIEKNLAKLPDVDKKKSEADLEVAEETYNEILVDLEEVQKQLITTESDASYREELVSEIEEIEEEIKQLADIRRQQKVLQYAVAAVPRLKKRKLHKIICAIRDVLPRYAGTMFSHEPNTSFVVEEDEESMELLCKRLVPVHGSMESVMVPVKGFSGGEKQRLSVALLFTLHSLLDPGKRPDVLILDEVDKGLDEQGVASLMSLVMEVRDQYGTVIMTSHRAQISGAKFDRSWSVEKTNEVSTLVA
ncbi:MAG: hypothetical protein NWE76_02530 [Candidatus Bathyarchaeota archaeon]|nr:hypothetical protein [Candidatus Bathyarchaeota archaeon]